jgi:hypothetical protein
MSDPTFNTPTYRRQQGSVFTVDSGGTLQILAGGSIQNAGGVSLGAGVSVTNLTVGGTLGRWAFGTAGFASGVGTIATGLTRVVSASIQPISPDAPGLGSFVTAVIDLSLSGAGSIIVRAGAGTLPYTNGGTYAWQAFGT